MIERARRKLDGQAKLLSTLSYQNVLARGFTLVRGADGAMLRRVSEVKPGAALDIEFADGHIGAHADLRARTDLRARKPEASAKEPRKPTNGKQGTLL
jgi:exodeoxyribonuclease VII large subunit